MYPREMKSDTFRMGGLLIADAARDIATNTRKGDQMWPKIVALCAFDTPVSSFNTMSCEITS